MPIKSIDKNESLLLELLDEEYTRHPFYGSRRMTKYLCGRIYDEGKKIGWKDGVRAIYCIVKYHFAK